MGIDHEDLIWREDAVDRALNVRDDFLGTLDTESVPVEQLSDRILAESIVADRNDPEHDFATMDGFAFDATDSYPLRIVDDEVYPEHDPGSIERGEAIRVATGAPIPERANAVLKREEATVEDGLLRGAEIDPGTYMYERGSNIREGEVLFTRGERVSAKDAILLANLGRDRVEAVTRFSTGLLATGTEIHEGISRDLDSPMLAALVRSWGHDPTYEGTVPDEYDRVETAIDELAGRHDVIVTTGGTSVGRKDYVIRALDELGSVLFHRVRIRPGKPIAVARLPEHDAIAFAIPGKPIGAHTVATLVMRAFFTGERQLPIVTATMDRTVSLGPEGFEYAIPVSLTTDEGSYRAMPLGHVDSPLAVYDEQFDPSVLSSSTRASRADGLVLTKTSLEADERVDVVPYSAIE